MTHKKGHKGLRLVGEPTTRKATEAEITLSKAQIAGTATEEQFEAAGVSAPKRQKEVKKIREEIKEERAPTDTSIKSQLKRQKELPLPLKILTSPKTTIVLGAVLVGVSTASFLTGTIVKTAAEKGSLIGKHINVDLIGKQLGLTARQTAALAKEVGRRRISQIANTITNPKSAGLMTNILKKTFSGKALAFFGVAASTIFLGKWGQAEAGEPISIIMKDVLREAGKTGDYTLYNEAAAARDELTDLSKWEQILSNTPFISPFIGIPNKIKGVKQAGAIMDELAKQQQIQQETGESDEEKWARIDKEREERRERERIEDEQYYAQVTEDLAAAKKEARRDEEKYWRGVLADREKAAKAKREADEKYWADIRRANSELKEEQNRAFEEYGRSNLDFGLL